MCFWKIRSYLKKTFLNLEGKKIHKYRLTSQFTQLGKDIFPVDTNISGVRQSFVSRMVFRGFTLFQSQYLGVYLAEQGLNLSEEGG